MYDLVVVGGGSGGLSVASRAALVGARVALVEKDRLGGECTHTACVPSKALIHAARIAFEARHAGNFGIRVDGVAIDFPAVMRRVRETVESFAGSGSGESLEAKGIDLYWGEPSFEAYDTVYVREKDRETRRVIGRKFVLATGSRGAVPTIPGLTEAGYLDNRTIWDLDRLPASLVVIGGGPVGLELGQAFSRLGSDVTVVEGEERILPREDPEISEFVRERLSAEGLTFHENATIQSVRVEGDAKIVRFTDGSKGDGNESEIRAERILVAAGRIVNVDGLNLESLNIRVDPARGIEVDEYLRTRAPNIYAIGDVLGHHQWTHAAQREADVAFRNAVLNLPTKIDYRAVPWATFTDPEVAGVGLSEHDAHEADLDFEVYRSDFDVSARARIDEKAQGFLKVVADPRGRILGATCVGFEASSILQGLVHAMEHGLNLSDLARTVHPYPTYAGLVATLASQYSSRRFERGLIPAALRWVYGYQPRTGGDEPSRVTTDQRKAAPRVEAGPTNPRDPRA